MKNVLMYLVVLETFVAAVSSSMIMAPVSLNWLPGVDTSQMSETSIVSSGSCKSIFFGIFVLQISNSLLSMNLELVEFACSFRIHTIVLLVYLLKLSICKIYQTEDSTLLIVSVIGLNVNFSVNIQCINNPCVYNCS